MVKTVSVRVGPNSQVLQTPVSMYRARVISVGLEGASTVSCKNLCGDPSVN